MTFDIRRHGHAVTAALVIATAPLISAPMGAPRTASLAPRVQLAQVYAAPVGEGDAPIGGPMAYGAPVGSGPIGGPMVYGDPVGSGPIGGPMIYGNPVGSGPIGGPAMYGSPVDSGGDDAPVGGDTLY
jgi:hypothetical protein